MPPSPSVLVRSSRSWAIKGTGVGVAVIDSGITSWHDDLTYNGTSTRADERWSAGGRASSTSSTAAHRRTTTTVTAATSPAPLPATATTRYGARAGIAPEAHLVGLKVLDENGRGVISDVIAALDWVVANKNAYNIRVANLSVGAAVTESYRTDPLTLAAKRAVDAGIVVVAAAGNLGRNTAGPDAVRRDHGAGQRAVGADGRRLQPRGHAASHRRRDGGVQLARAFTRSTSRRSRTSSRPARASSR